MTTAVTSDWLKIDQSEATLSKHVGLRVYILECSIQMRAELEINRSYCLA